MARVGVCEDQAAIRKVLGRALRQAGHEVVMAHTGQEALQVLCGPLDVLLLDIGLPDADGRDVLQALRAGGQRAPVLLLTALGATHEKLQGFAAGADDYVVKPFDILEVLARVEVLAARRVDPSQVGGRLELDPVAFAVRVGDREARLTPTEFRMLGAILARPGEVVRRHRVVAAGWPDGAIVAENTVDSFVRRIRSKLEAIDSPEELQTVRGVGFRWVPRSGQ